MAESRLQKQALDPFKRQRASRKLRPHWSPRSVGRSILLSHRRSRFPAQGAVAGVLAWVVAYAGGADLPAARWWGLRPAGAGRWRGRGSECETKQVGPEKTRRAEDWLACTLGKFLLQIGDCAWACSCERHVRDQNRLAPEDIQGIRVRNQCAAMRVFSSLRPSGQPGLYG